VTHSCPKSRADVYSHRRLSSRIRLSSRSDNEMQKCRVEGARSVTSGAAELNHGQSQLALRQALFTTGAHELDGCSSTCPQVPAGQRCASIWDRGVACYSLGAPSLSSSPSSVCSACTALPVAKTLTCSEDPPRVLRSYAPGDGRSSNGLRLPLLSRGTRASRCGRWSRVAWTISSEPQRLRRAHNPGTRRIQEIAPRVAP
jgi:hypothetical protein